MSIFRESSEYHTDTVGDDTYTIAAYDPGYASSVRGRIIFVVQANSDFDGIGSPLISVTYGGATMNLCFPTLDYTGPFDRVRIFYVINPPTGAQDITFTSVLGDMGDMRVGIVAYYSDTDTSFRLGTRDPNGIIFGQAGTSLTRTLTSKSGNSWLFGAAINFDSENQTLSFSESQGPRNGLTFADDSTIGTQSWSNPERAELSDNSIAGVILSSGAPVNIIEESIKIVKGGTISGDEKSTGALLPTSDTYVEYGGISDLWGVALTPADINASDFGVVFSCESPTLISHYLKATNFGFAIPTGATIDGVKVEIEQRRFWNGGFTFAFVDHIRITVYYTNASGIAYVDGAGNPSSFQIVDSGEEVPPETSVSVTSTVSSAPSGGLHMGLITFLPIRTSFFRFITDLQ